MPPVAKEAPRACASREVEYLVAAVRRFLDANAPPPDSTRIDLPTTLSLTIAHSIVPIVYRVMKELGDPSAEVFRSTFDDDARFSLALAAELCAIAEQLQDRGIPFLPLKGPMLSQRLHGDPAIRASGDLDILIQPGDVLAVRDLLIGTGYRVASPTHWPGDSACLKSRECELLMAHREHQLTVDLHWRILPWYFASGFDESSVWKRLTEGSFAGRQMPDLSAEDLLLFLCGHGSKHAFERLLWITDIASCLRKHQVDWDSVWSMASQSGTARQVLLGVRLARNLLDTPVPTPQPTDAAVEHLAQITWQRLLRATPPPTPERELIPFCLELFESTRHRVRYLAGHLSPSAAEYQALKLPPALHFLYYPLRPVRVASRHLGSALRRALERPSVQTA